MSDAIHPDLLAMMQVAGHEGDRSTVCQAVTQQALAASRASLATLSFVHPAKAALVVGFVAGADRPPFDRVLAATHIDLIGSCYSLDTPWVRAVLEEGRPVRGQSLASLLPAAVPPAVSSALARAARFRDWLGMPLHGASSVVGMLGLVFTADDPEPDPGLLRACTQITALVLSAHTARTAQLALHRLVETLTGRDDPQPADDAGLEIHLRPDRAGRQRPGIQISLLGPAAQQAAGPLDGLIDALASGEIELQRAGDRPGWALYPGGADPTGGDKTLSGCGAQQTAGGAGSSQILLVEDNLVNQQMTRTILEKRGWQVTVAPGGQQAVEMLAQQSFDLVLMDIEMPGLDGLSAARQIRLQERVHGKHTPIICMSAHSARSDHLRILQAGMDGQLAKPIRPQQLLETVEQTLAPVSAAAGLETLLNTLGDDRELLAEIADLFLHHYPGLLDELATALSDNDTDCLTRAAHTLKGECAQFGAEEARAAAYELEMMGRELKLAEAPAALFRLRIGLARFVGAMRRSDLLPG